MTSIQQTLDLTTLEDGDGESFSVVGECIRRRIVVHDTVVVDAQIATSVGVDPKGAWWRAYLEGSKPTPMIDRGRTLRTVDLFSGAGGLAQGIRQFALEAGYSVVPELIVDQDREAMDVYTANHGARRRIAESVSTLVDFQVRGQGKEAELVYEPELLDPRAEELTGSIDLVLAGPPCQGHSNLNNHTRREDRRNALYLTVPAITIALRAPVAIIENVPAVLHDSFEVVDGATAIFEAAGYSVASGVLSASAMGWPQHRKRHFLIARRDGDPLPLSEVAQLLADQTARSVWWAIGDLEDRVSDDIMDQHTELSEENRARVDWLFDNDAYELALPQRPDSHKEGTTYTSVYGRMRKDEPAPTITTGFMSPGRGRYVHPTRRRVLTAREAARLQGFPDTYVFAPDSAELPARAKLAKWIGDAVPMPLGYAAALASLAHPIC